MTNSTARPRPAAPPTAPNYNRTIIACFNGYITQAIINNFMPLLFVTFSTTLGIDMARLSTLITTNFVTQLVVDILAGRYVDRIGYKPCIIAAHVAAATGLLMLGLAPTRLDDPYPALLAAIMMYAVGGGLIEVMVSPIVNACPSDHKAEAMSLLHSFYCWGQVATVLVSTLFFAVAGREAWPAMACLWAIVPLAGIVLFAISPMPSILPEGTSSMALGQLARNPLFIVFFIMMLCAGASELGMSQWASTFAETGLDVSKTVGDLAGPAAFAVFMGLSRTIYGIFGHKLNLTWFIAASAVLGVTTYLIATLSPSPVAGLTACALTGFAVGIMWPGTFALAADAIPAGGTLMFALFAVAGDLGCAAGPAIIGAVAAANGDNVQHGLMIGTLFPALLLAGVVTLRQLTRRRVPSPRKNDPNQG